MKSIPAILLLLMFTGIHPSCERQEGPGPNLEPEQIEITAETRQLIDSDNQFGIELFKIVNQQQETDSNTMISPLSVSLALAMTYNGALGDTKKAMEETMYLNDLSVEQINESFETLMEALMSVDPKVTMEIANSIWYRENYPVIEDFIQVNRNYYDAEVRSMDFGDPQAIDIINQWCADKTHNKIKKILDVIPGNAVMYLINALYFNGAWKYEFDKSKTGKELFYLGDGTSEQIDMMHMEADVGYLNNELFSAIELPYGRGNYSMVCMLPREDLSVNDVIAGITEEKWNEWMDHFTETGCRIGLPKFKFEYFNLLNDALKSMGMEIAFSQGADFSNIVEGGGIWISRVLHKTFIEVDEKGTEAAAVTAVEMREVSAPGGPRNITFNRPFLFAIREVTTNTIVFLGKFVEPAQKE